MEGLPDTLPTTGKYAIVVPTDQKAAIRHQNPVVFSTIASTVNRLGWLNVGRVVFFRICKQVGLYRWLLPRHSQVKALDFDFERDVCARPGAEWADGSVLKEAKRLISGTAEYFSVHSFPVGSPPDWFVNPFTGERHPQRSRHWSQIAYFSEQVGDIKGVWEMSRFTWALTFARAFRVSGDECYRAALELWIQDWWQRNPPNSGPNWMCGQEAAIRLINTIMAVRIAGYEPSRTPLTEFVQEHCRRIDATTSYAIAQDNNHTTSEAAGLYVGGTWLVAFGRHTSNVRSRRWAEKGRRLLERSARRLISEDGSFSQQSLTYHRLMLDTLSLVEVFRRGVDDAPFSADFYRRSAAATRWLEVMVDETTGDGPNLGANDGANPFRLSQRPYRDFRPSLQLASNIFTSPGVKASSVGGDLCKWLELPCENSRRRGAAPGVSAFRDGGYVVISNIAGAKLILRTPTARFRPPHADALHIDLWWKGNNVLRDGGTYAYANGGEVSGELASVVGHNTVQFDDRDQMPKLGRFLYGDWIRVEGAPESSKGEDTQSWSGSYTDGWGTRHTRQVTLQSNSLRVVDSVQGFRHSAKLRWRLMPGDWSHEAGTCISSVARIRIETNGSNLHTQLASGWESRHYMEKSKVPVFEAEVRHSPAQLITIISLF